MYKFSEIKEHLDGFREEDGFLVKEICGYKVKLLLFDHHMIIVVRNNKELQLDKTITEEEYNRYGNKRSISDHIYDMALRLDKIELMEIKSKVWKT